MAAEEVARIRNIGIVGQGGVGKTLLADALILAAGGATRLGRTDDGSSLFDVEPEEVRRKTSISTALHHVAWRKHDLTVVDTPGYAAFLADTSPNAYEKVVDRLLASPRYAERQAMAWLDAARFADTNGFNNDEDRTQWPWRDWLIEAFARNLPFDRFLVEQLAGDLLPDAKLDQRVATAFLRNQVHNTEGGIIPEEYRVEYVADRVHTTATVFLGLSMQCARCHDHKYDPITQREYYQFFSFFQNIADKPASYSNFVGAEPYIRVPSSEQRSRLESLDARRLVLEKELKSRESAVDAACAMWEKSLTPEARQKLAGAGSLLRVPLDEKDGANVATSEPAIRGTIRGKPMWGPGKIAGALEFDGATFVEVANAPSFEGDSPFSIGIWAFPTANDLLALASKMDDGAGHRGWDMLLENGKISTHLVNCLLYTSDAADE